MGLALFDIDDDGEDRGYEAETEDTLTLRLRQQPPLGVTSVQFQVWDPSAFDASRGIAGNPPRASRDAPTLTLVGATSGQLVSPATVGGSVTVTLPDSDGHSWIVRCIVNGGVRTLASGAQVVDPTLIHERGIFIPNTRGTRKIVFTETTQFDEHGWAETFNAGIVDGALVRDPLEVTTIRRPNEPDGPQIVLIETGIELSLGGTPLLTLGVKPSIAGTTTQEQIDSLVAALVALDLVTDDRP